MRSLIVLSLCAVLAGCGMTRQIEQGEAEAASRADAEPVPFDLNDAVAACQRNFPDQIAQAVARAGCVIKATEMLRPLLPLPELLDQENMVRKSLAEQVQNGQMSLLQRNYQMYRAHMSLLEQEQAKLQSAPAQTAKAPIAVM